MRVQHLRNLQQRARLPQLQLRVQLTPAPGPHQHGLLQLRQRQRALRKLQRNQTNQQTRLLRLIPRKSPTMSPRPPIRHRRQLQSLEDRMMSHREQRRKVLGVPQYKVTALEDKTMSLRELLPRARHVHLHKAILRLQSLFQARVTMMPQTQVHSLRILESARGHRVEAVSPSIPPQPLDPPPLPAARSP